MGKKCHVARKSLKVPAEELGWNLTLRRESPAGLPHHKKPAPNGFGEASRIIRHLLWLHRQQTHPAALIKLMNAASHRILTVKDHLGDLWDTHWPGRQQNDLASRLDRGIGSSMVKFLDHLLLSGLQIAHVDFTWPGYGSTSLISFWSFILQRFPQRFHRFI